MRAAPEDHHFHVGVGLFGYLVALSVAVTITSLVTAVAGYAGTGSEAWPLGLIVANQALLWLCFLAVVFGASRWWGTGSLRHDYGLSFRRFDVLGLAGGVVLQFVFVPALYWVLGPLYRWLFTRTKSSWFDTSQLKESAKSITGKANGTIGLIALFVILSIGAPFIEELLFRGLVLRSFQARNRDSLALVGSAVLFGAGHLQGLQFPALVMFGLVVGYVAQRTKRLGPSIFIHMGFNASTTLWLFTHRN